MHLGLVGAAEIGILALVVTLGGVLPALLLWRIFAKAGLPTPVALLALLPPFGIVSLAVLALAEWPQTHRDPQSGTGA